MPGLGVGTPRQYRAKSTKLTTASSNEGCNLSWVLVVSANPTVRRCPDLTPTTRTADPYACSVPTYTRSAAWASFLILRCLLDLVLVGKLDRRVRIADGAKNRTIILDCIILGESAKFR